LWPSLWIASDSVLVAQAFTNPSSINAKEDGTTVQQLRLIKLIHLTIQTNYFIIKNNNAKKIQSEMNKLKIRRD